MVGRDLTDRFARAWARAKLGSTDAARRAFISEGRDERLADIEAEMIRRFYSVGEMYRWD